MIKDKNMADEIQMKKETGLVHIYTGDGKGKTTAAAGLAPFFFTAQTLVAIAIPIFIHRIINIIIVVINIIADSGRAKSLTFLGSVIKNIERRRFLRYSGYKAAVITAFAYSATTLAIINSLPLCSSFC